VSWHQAAAESARRTPLAEVNIDELARLYGNGWSLKRIAQRFRVEPTSVHYRLRRAGVVMRARNGWLKT
jgi:DNA-directed RNA polymerase specialized sigma24 family protein